MKKLLFLLPFFVPSLSFAATCFSIAPATPVNQDQHYNQIVSSTAGWGERNSQNFTLSSDCTVTALSSVLFKNGSPSDNITYSVFAVSGGNPTGSALLSAAPFAGSAFSAYPTVTPVSSAVAGSPLLTAGTYAFVITRQTFNTSNYYNGMVQTGSSPEINAYYNGAWGTIGTGYNLPIEIDGTSPTPPVVPTGGATSTIEQAQSNLTASFFLFFVAFFGTIWLLAS